MSSDRDLMILIEDIVENETMRAEMDASGHMRRTIIEHKGDLHPQIIIVQQRNPRSDDLLTQAPEPPSRSGFRSKRCARRRMFDQ